MGLGLSIDDTRVGEICDVSLVAEDDKYDNEGEQVKVSEVNGGDDSINEGETVGDNNVKSGAVKD